MLEKKLFIIEIQFYNKSLEFFFEDYIFKNLFSGNFAGKLA